MAVDVNYWWIGLLVLCAVILFTWLLRRNNKDQKELEKEIIKSELKPEKPDDAEDRTINL